MKKQKILLLLFFCSGSWFSKVLHQSLLLWANEDVAQYQGTHSGAKLLHAEQLRTAIDIENKAGSLHSHVTYNQQTPNGVFPNSAMGWPPSTLSPRKTLKLKSSSLHLPC